MRLTQLTEGPCDVAKPEEIEKMSGTEYDKYAQWKKDCEADERTTPLSTKRMSEKAKPDFLDLDKDGDKKEPMKSAGKQKKEVCEETDEEEVSEDLEDIGNAVKKGYNKVKDLANKKIPTHQEKYGFKRPWLSVDLDNKVSFLVGIKAEHLCVQNL